MLSRCFPVKRKNQIPYAPPADAQTTSNPKDPIEVNSMGRFYPDSVDQRAYTNATNTVYYPPGSYGARMVILLHELAHKVMPQGIVGDRFSDADSMKNTQKVIEHCAAAINAQTPKQ